MFIGSVII